MSDIGNLEQEKETRVERLKTVTSNLSEFLLRADPKIKKVGIAGSLARGQNPHDIDLIIFLDERTASRVAIDENGRNFFEYLNLDIEEEGELFELLIQLAFLNCEVDVTFLPDNPSKEFISFFTKTNRDPNFLQNVVNDLLIYDQNSKKFNHYPIFDPKKIRLIKQASFDDLKELVHLTNPLLVRN